MSCHLGLAVSLIQHLHLVLSIVISLLSVLLFRVFLSVVVIDPLLCLLVLHYVAIADAVPIPLLLILYFVVLLPHHLLLIPIICNSLVYTLLCYLG